MKYLVTGGTGFLGKYIVDYLQKQGCEVYVATRLPSNKNHILADFEKGILDLTTNPDFVSDPSELVVIHAAGKAHSVPKSEIERKNLSDVNVGGTQLLLNKLDTLPTLPLSLIFISSVSIYGRESGFNIDENEPLNATDHYGISKLKSEGLILEWGRKNAVIIGIVRLPLVTGKNPPGNLRAMVKGIKSGAYFRIGNGANRRSMVRAADIASILPIIAQKGGIYNLTDGFHPSFAELEDAIVRALHTKQVKKMPVFLAKLLGFAGSFIEKILDKKMPLNSRMITKITKPLIFSDQKARHELGWNPTKVLDHIEEILQ